MTLGLSKTPVVWRETNPRECVRILFARDRDRETGTCVIMILCSGGGDDGGQSVAYSTHGTVSRPDGRRASRRGKNGISAGGFVRDEAGDGA